MNRSLLLGVVLGAVFVLALVVGAMTADAMRDVGGGDLVLPDTMGDPIPLLPPVEVAASDLDEELIPDLYREIEVGGGFYRFDPSDTGVEGGDADLGDGGSSGGESSGSEAGGPRDASVEMEGRGYPWEVPSLSIDAEWLLFDDFGWGFLRWIDFCADNPVSPSCPSGVGGTVLVPFDGELGAIGDFSLRNQAYWSPASWWTCAPPADLSETQHFVVLVASHPARIEIDYHPGTAPDISRSVVIDHTDPADPVYEEFVSTVTETGSPPLTGVHHCFVLEGDRLGEVYAIEARATSITGEVDEKTVYFPTPETRSRPPVQLAPVGDYRATLVVPVTSDPRSSSLVRLMPSDEAGDCSTIEDSSLSRIRSEVVPVDPGQPSSGFHGRESIGEEVVNGPDWRFDPAYDAYDYWTLNLREGSTYRVCVWWLGSGARSFDPREASVVERETRWLSTPDLMRASVRIAGVQAPTSRAVAAESFTLVGDRPCRAVPLPSTAIPADSGVFYQGGLPLCDFEGFAQPARTQISVRFTDGSQRDFLVDTPNAGEPGITRVRLDLSTVRGAGLCGGSFGSCDPPTTTVPGPVILLDVAVFPDSGRVGGSWRLGDESLFDPPSREPADLPEHTQIDRFRSGVEAVGRESLEVTASFDRPVTLRGYVVSNTGEELCATGEIGEYSSETLRVDHSFRINGLCPLTWYSIDLEATDAAGTTTRFTYSPVGDGERRWIGGGVTDGYHVTYQIGYRSSVIDPMKVVAFEVSVSGRWTSMRTESRCLITTMSDPEERIWGEEVTIEVQVRFGEATRIDGLCDARPRGGRWWEASVTASFSIDDFLAGTIVIPIGLEPVVGFTPIPDALEVVITGFVR